MSTNEDVLLRSFDARTAAWAQWGAVEADVLTHIINPFFTGGPRWPALREAFRVVRRNGAILIASDGLSDPYDADEGAPAVNGLGLEVFALTSDKIDSIPGSWLFQLVWQASQFAASRGDLADLLEEYQLLSTEVHDVDLPEERRRRFVGPEGRVGVMLNLVEGPLPERIQGPLSAIRLVNLKLLTVEEVAFIVQHGPEGRTALARRFDAPKQRSSLERHPELP